MINRYFSAIGLTLVCMTAAHATEEKSVASKWLPEFSSKETALVYSFDRADLAYGHVNFHSIGMKSDAEYEVPSSLYYGFSGYVGGCWKEAKIDFLKDASYKTFGIDMAAFGRVGYSWKFFDSWSVTPYFRLGYLFGFPEAQYLKNHTQILTSGVGLKSTYDIREDFSVGVDFSIGHGLVGHCKSFTYSATQKPNDFTFGYNAYMPLSFKPKGLKGTSFVLTPSYSGSDVREKGNFGMRFATSYSY